MKARMAGGAAISLSALAALGLGGCATLRGTFVEEVRREYARQSDTVAVEITEEALAPLPEPVRRHFRVCGLVGSGAGGNVRIVWDEFSLKRGRDKGWMQVKAEQYNFTAEPARIVYMGGRLAGFIPFAGRDKYQDGHGNMLIKAMGFVKVAEAKSRHMDESALVTLLAEALLVPGHALQPYISWKAVDSSTASAAIEHKGIRVSGTFHFNAAGENIRFTTQDRWQDGYDSSAIPWSVYPSEYAAMGGIRAPSRYTAVWHEKAGDFEYFRGRIGRFESGAPTP